MKKIKFNLAVCFLFIAKFILIQTSGVFAQNTGMGINISGTPANSKAMLDIDATGMNPKAGVLLPRMSIAERNAITAPVPESLIIYNTDTHCFEAYYNGAWVAFGCLVTGCPIPVQPGSISGTGTVCLNQNGVGFSVANEYGVSYIWNYSGSGFTIVSGSGTNSITANFSALATSDTLRVTGSNKCGISPEQKLAITAKAIPVAPTAGTNSPTITQIIWNWNTVSGAIGYQWNTSGTYPGTGVNVVSNASYTQTGLICNTPYTLYVWAYNECGYNAIPTILSQSTSPCPCVTCNAYATYGTITRGAKTWMDRNLGACQQAVSTTDYRAYGSFFQFGRKKDGHECMYWDTNTDKNHRPAGYTTSSTQIAYNASSAQFITSNGASNDCPANNWATTYQTSANLWPASTTMNTPCPSGYHVPTSTEWTTEMNSWGGITADNAYTYLKLPLVAAMDYRDGLSTWLTGYTYGGWYWTSTVGNPDTNCASWVVTSGSGLLRYRLRNDGMAVRCISN